MANKDKEFKEKEETKEKTEAEEVKDFFAENATNCSKWQSAGGKFAGTLDFNGAHIVGCYNLNGGLFQEVGMGAVIKNFELSHSYIEGGDYVGSVVSVLRENGENKGKVTFENAIISISVTNRLPHSIR